MSKPTHVKELIANLLRNRSGKDTATRFLRTGDATIEFGPYVCVYISESIGNRTISVGVNWSALGTVDASVTEEMSQNLGRAANLARTVLFILESRSSEEDAE